MSDRLVSNLIHVTFKSFIGDMIVALGNRLSPKIDGEWFDTTEIDLELPHLPPAFDGYRLAHITDFHIGTFIDRQRLEEGVAAVNALKPDLIAITGDFMTFNPEKYVDDLVIPLRKLQAYDGVYAVLGNHDYWTDPGIVRFILRESNICDMSNRTHTIQRDGQRLWLAGVDDQMLGQDRLDLVLQQIPPGEHAILLAHEPDFADLSAPTRRFDLQLSGHTHGGQINLPLIGNPYLPHYGRKYPSGMYRVGDMALYTNRGLGTAELQLRVNCRAEIALFTLHAS